MDIGVAGIDVKELVEMGVYRHDGESPLVTKSTLERIRRFSLLMTLYSSTNPDKLSGGCFSIGGGLPSLGIAVAKAAGQEP
jgi:hypothetical protein